MTGSTRERILDAALELFAARGYRATTVGDIEAAAGLTPRAGGAYRHFRGKSEILAAAVDRQVEQIITMRAAVIELLPLGDARAELTLLVRWVFAELTRERQLTAILERDGEAVPDLRNRFRDAIADSGFQAGTDAIRDRAAALGLAPEVDIEALAVLGVGALVNYRRHQWTFQSAPLGVSEDRVIDALVTAIAGPPPPSAHNRSDHE